MAQSPHDVFLSVEAKDGVRFSWNVFPSTAVESTLMAVPVSAVYTPLKDIPNLPRLQSPPVQCTSRACGTVLNPYCQLDFINKKWLCPLCGVGNHFPPGYQLSAQQRPAEVLPAHTTIEYIQDANIIAPTFLFVIDLCNFEEELLALRGALSQNLMLLPEDANVGLITFGRNVYVHKLRSEETRYVVLNGEKDYKISQLKHLLGMPESKDAKTPAPVVDSPFIVPLAEFDSMISSHLDQLRPDCWPNPRGQRWSRAVGGAMNAAVGLMSAIKARQPGRILTFLGGPCTFGPGLVVAPDRKESIRSHHDIVKNRAIHYKKACKYYERLATELVASEHTVDIYACALDQMGLAEMRVLVERTGGYGIR
jgi:protein transport protein SEC23